MEEFHNDIREIRNLVTENLRVTTQIQTAIWPSPGQPSLLERHDERIDKLEGWRNWLAGIGSAVTLAISLVFGIHISGSGK